jgi:protein-L-isoaspartate(D-aspartate) O-methyltransferase
MEIDNKLVESSRNYFKAKGYEKIKIFSIDGFNGMPAPAFLPFDRILVSAGYKEIPNPLLEQLSDPGILVVPVNSKYDSSGKNQSIFKLTKKSGIIMKEEYENFGFVPMRQKGESR